MTLPISPRLPLLLVLGIGIVTASPATPIPEYVIVTSQLLAPEFEPLASWYTARGMPTEVRTVEWIVAQYPGVDDAERVRLFLRDAYISYGTQFVLLGGDADVVPVRYVRSTYQAPTDILSDYYFMCLEGTWNADGDQHFGEVEDEVDLLPEISAGRAPVSSVLEARAFVERTIDYAAFPAGPSYPASALFIAERMGAIHGATIAEAARAFLTPSFALQRLYTEAENWPGAIELTRQVAFGELDTGYGLALHVGTGDESSWGLGDAPLSIADVQALDNAPRFSVVYGFAGRTAAFDADDAIGEHWLTSRGGAAAYVGCTNLAWPSPADELLNEWMRRIFVAGGDHIGSVCALARHPLVDQAQTESAARWMIFTLALLGDPGLVLRIDTPAALDPVAAASQPALVLSNPTPNPFGAHTTIVLDLAFNVESSRLGIYDTCGRLRDRLVSGPLMRGRHVVRWSPERMHMPLGVYFVRFEANGIALSRKIVRSR